MEAMALLGEPQPCPRILDDKEKSIRTCVFHFHFVSLLESVLPFVVLERTELHSALRAVERNIDNEVAQSIKHCV